MSKQIKQEKSWIDGHNLDELLSTTNLDILPDFSKEVIREGNLTTSRKVIIETLPERKEISDKQGNTKKADYITISDNGIIYQCPCGKACQRSLISLAIKLKQKELKRKLKDKSEIDLSIILGKVAIARRRVFKTDDMDEPAQPIQFFMC